VHLRIKLKPILITGIISIVAFSYVVFVGLYKTPPFKQLQQLKRLFVSRENEKSKYSPYSRENEKSKCSTCYLEKKSMFEQHGKQSKIVMVGDSITARANWQELLDRHDIINRGICGDTTSGILNRTVSIFSAKPQTIFYMAGINDINEGVAIEQIINNVNEFIRITRKNNIKVIVQSVLLTDSVSMNNKVHMVNEQLIGICQKNNVTFIDINKALGSEKNDKLNLQHTYDGIHLNGTAYGLWVNELKKYLA
jgi:lysophospholipase L1-like esterase